VPSSWTGLGPLLGGAGERAPTDALTLAAVATGAGPADGRAQVELSGIWAQSADMAAARSTTLMRTLDAKGRLQLPVDAGAATRLPAERDGALVSVYLPGSPGPAASQLRHQCTCAGCSRLAHRHRRCAPRGRHR
jgi:hypothetical protein